MDPATQKAAIRFIQSLEKEVYEETFSDEDAWGIVGDLLPDYIDTGRALHAGQVAALIDFGHTIGIRPGGPLSSYKPCLEHSLGPAPFLDDDLDQILRWVFEQVNANFGMKRPEKINLNPGPPGPPPPPGKPLW